MPATSAPAAAPVAAAPAPKPGSPVCSTCGKIVRNGKGHDPRCVHAGASATTAAAKPKSAATPKPKSPAAPAKDQAAPKAPAKPKEPKRVIAYHVIPRRGKTQINDDTPATMILIRSTVNTPWEPGAIRLLNLRDKDKLPAGPFNLAHAKTGNWLAEWTVIDRGEEGVNDDVKAAQVWDCTDPVTAEAK
jgi:hypothetical protein